MPNRDLDDDVVEDPLADEEEEEEDEDEAFGSADEDDEELEDDEDEEFEDDDEDEETELTGEVGSEGGSPGETVERRRSRSGLTGSEAAGLARDEDLEFRNLRGGHGGLRKRTP